MTKTKKVSLRYVGRRLLNNEKIAHAYSKPDGETVFFTKVKWSIIGRSYFATTDGDGLTMHVRPEEDEAAVQPSDEDLETWQVADALAYDMQRRKQLSAKLNKKPPALERAVNAIRPLVKGLNFSQRRQLIEILVTQCDRNNP